MSRYIGTISIVNICFGFVVGLTMFILGLPQAYLWGVLAAVLNFALFVGPIIMAIVLLGVGLATFNDPLIALLPCIVYIVLNMIEGQFVTPAVLGARLTLNPLLVFLAIAFWLWLWGPIGAFLAVPMLIICTMMLYHVVPRFAPRNYVEFTRATRDPQFRTRWLGTLRVRPLEAP